MDMEGCYPWEDIQKARDERLEKPIEKMGEETTEKKLMRPQTGEEVDG